LPLLARAGAIVPMTDAGDDYLGLHDEPSRALRVFPGPGSGSGHFVLFEDDGISAVGATTRVTCDLDWTRTDITLAVRADGDFALPYQHITVVPPRAERRRVTLKAGVGSPALQLG
jgi:alpha-glucosidase (family GH31 glycosyl hydrolase)